MDVQSTVSWVMAKNPSDQSNQSILCVIYGDSSSAMQCPCVKCLILGFTQLEEAKSVKMNQKS